MHSKRSTIVEIDDKIVPLKHTYLNPNLNDLNVESNLDIKSNIKMDFGVSMSDQNFKGVGLPYSDKIKKESSTAKYSKNEYN